LPCHCAADNGEQEQVPAPLPSAPFYGKIGSAAVCLSEVFAVALPLRPWPHPKNRKRTYGQLFFGISQGSGVMVMKVNQPSEAAKGAEKYERI